MQHRTPENSSPTIPGEYRVPQLSLASYFVALGHRVLRFEPTAANGHRWVTFIFEDAPPIHEARERYFHYQGQIDARTHTEAFRLLKRQAAEILRGNPSETNHDES